VNRVEVIRDGVVMVPEHLSKAQDIALKPGDRVRVRTPGGGGYGPPGKRDPALVAEDVRLGRYSAEEAERLWPGLVRQPLGNAELTASDLSIFGVWVRSGMRMVSGHTRVHMDRVNSAANHGTGLPLPP
jgi:hypothetical protein